PSWPRSSSWSRSAPRPAYRRRRTSCRACRSSSSRPCACPCTVSGRSTRRRERGGRETRVGSRRSSPASLRHLEVQPERPVDDVLKPHSLVERPDAGGAPNLVVDAKRGFPHSPSLLAGAALGHGGIPAGRRQYGKSDSRLVSLQ